MDMEAKFKDEGNWLKVWHQVVLIDHGQNGREH